MWLSGDCFSANNLSLKPPKDSGSGVTIASDLSVGLTRAIRETVLLELGVICLFQCLGQFQGYRSRLVL